MQISQLRREYHLGREYVCIPEELFWGMSMRQELHEEEEMFLLLHNTTCNNAFWISSPLMFSHGSAGHVLENLN